MMFIMNETSRSVLINDFELSENLPVCTFFNLAEIRKVAHTKLGLRSTSPSRVDAEMKAGVEGDYVLLSDFSHLVHIDRVVLTQFIERISGSPYQGGFTQDNLFRDILAQGVVVGDLPKKYQDIIDQINVSGVPIRFEEALRQFLLKKAIPAVPYQFTSDTVVSQYLDDLVGKASPSLLIVQSYDSSGYDYDNYFGLGKRGKAFISPNTFIARTGLTIEDVRLLRRRYQRYLEERVASFGSIKGQPEERFDKRIDRDVGEILLGNTVSTVRTIISSHASV